MAEISHLEPAVITDAEKIRAMRGPEEASDLSPIEIRFEGGAALFPRADRAPDEYEFLGPVKDVTAFELFEQNITRVTLAIGRRPDADVGDDIDIDLYVADHAWRSSERPQPGSNLRGLMWLQGYLAH